MELRQLGYFSKVAELKNFSEAARALCITQSTLSQQIRTLEGEVGAQLFVRDTHNVRLTDVGEALLESARQTLADAKSCMERIRDVQQLRTGEVNIGCTYTFSPLLTETVLAFTKKYPQVKVNIFCKSVEELTKMLERQEIDVMLSYKPAQVPPELESHIIFDNRLAVVVSDTHPLAARQHIRLVDLEHYNLALPAKGMQARSTFDRLTETVDYRFNVVLEINEVNVLLSLVRGSHLVTLLSSATARHCEGIRTLPLENPGCEMEGAFTLRRNTYMKFATQALIDLLRENCTLGLFMGL